jgi:hypothetical protein
MAIIVSKSPLLYQQRKTPAYRATRTVAGPRYNFALSNTHTLFEGDPLPQDDAVGALQMSQPDSGSTALWPSGSLRLSS